MPLAQRLFVLSLTAAIFGSPAIAQESAIEACRKLVAEQEKTTEGREMTKLFQEGERLLRLEQDLVGLQFSAERRAIEVQQTHASRLAVMYADVFEKVFKPYKKEFEQLTPQERAGEAGGALERFYRSKVPQALRKDVTFDSDEVYLLENESRVVRRTTLPVSSGSVVFYGDTLATILIIRGKPYLSVDTSVRMYHVERGTLGDRSKGTIYFDLETGKRVDSIQNYPIHNHQVTSTIVGNPMQGYKSNAGLYASKSGSCRELLKRADQERASRVVPQSGTSDTLAERERPQFQDHEYTPAAPAR